MRITQQNNTFSYKSLDSLSKTLHLFPIHMDLLVILFWMWGSGIEKWLEQNKTGVFRNNMTSEGFRLLQFGFILAPILFPIYFNDITPTMNLLLYIISYILYSIYYMIFTIYYIHHTI